MPRNGDETAFLNISVANGNGEKNRSGTVRRIRIPVVGINSGEWPERISGTGDTRHERRRKGGDNAINIEVNFVVETDSRGKLVYRVQARQMRARRA